MRAREYGQVARIGLGIPPANTTVEPEIAILMPPGVTVHTTRMSSSTVTVRQRLVDYLEGLEGVAESFYGAELDLLMFACTGSSYLVGREREAALLTEVSEKAKLPIVSTTGAIRAALDVLNSRRIAVIAPYPAWLVDAAVHYWHDAGITVVASEMIAIDEDRSQLGPSLRAIYTLRCEHVVEAMARLGQRVSWDGVDAVLLTGVGMPTLRAIAQLSPSTPKPIVSSTLCLAWAGRKMLGIDADPRGPAGSQPGGELLTAWLDRLPHEEAR